MASVSLPVCEYTKHLNDVELKRYTRKLDIIGACDPYMAPRVLFTPLTEAAALPALEFGDIMIYLVENPSPFTLKSMKAYKSTDSYRYFRAGWVNSPLIWNLSPKEIHIIKAKVRIP